MKHFWSLMVILAVLLWKKLMGNTVYDAGEPRREGVAVPAGTLEIAPGSCTFIVL